MSKEMRQELLLVAALLTFMMLVGGVTGHVVHLMLVVIMPYMMWHLYNLYRLTQWLKSPSTNVPEASGVWDEVYYQLYQLYQRQRNARRKLTSILSRFQESTQALPYATVVLNEFLEIEWFNTAAKQLFDLRANLDVGQRIDNLIRQPKFAAYLKSKQYESPLEFNLGDNHLVLTITRYGSGQYLLIVRDITERAKLDAMRRDFIANASHELKTPITVISGFVETLLDSADQQYLAPLESIHQQALRMQLMLDELLQLARLESLNYVEQPEPVDIAALLQEIYEDALTLDAGQHPIELKVTPMAIEGDREELRMAFSNLVLNAMRYTPEGRAIRILNKADNPGLIVGVEDDGIGITYEHIPRLTERFYRVDPGRSREKGGTGLGLAIVKHILDRHRATLEIRSTPGVGSEFLCRFPVTQAATAPQAAVT